MNIPPLAKIAKSLGYKLHEYTCCGSEPVWHVDMSGGMHSPADVYFADDGNAIELLSRWRAVEKGPRGAVVKLLASLVGFVEVELHTFASGSGEVILAQANDVTLAKAICAALVKCQE